MGKNIQAIRGMHDVLPSSTGHWQYLEKTIREVLNAYSYSEIRMPIVETTDLFKRSIGEVTDIVEKEMYTFADRNGDSLTLRPEGTAGCLRACLEHGLLHNQVQRLWYYGPMFRHERPQKGRYRQFVQLGVETYGMPGPDIDCEILLLTKRLWQRLGVLEQLKLEVNTLGTSAERMLFREQLVNYFSNHQDQLDEDSQRRLLTNPIRILDSKNPSMQQLITDAPKLIDFLNEDSRSHFNQFTATLDKLDIAYTINPRLVRGLDYYGKTVFEWVTDQLGAQGTVCAGGRYDDLVNLLGGKPNYAVGFAMGMERLLALLEASQKLPDQETTDVYLIIVGELAETLGFKFAEQLRDAVPTLKVQMHCGSGSFKSQFKKADKSGAEYALILGEEEATQKKISIKPLRDNQDQKMLEPQEVIRFLQNYANQN